jgi:branched-subunit amino acid ABC-type transport system permease component
MAFGLQLIGGLVSAAILFLIASGLTLIFGVCRVLNLAHGTFFMLAAYTAYTITAVVGGRGAGYWLALVLVPVLWAAIGALLERLLFRRLYDADILLQILPTIALVFLGQDLVKAVWGMTPHLVSAPAVLSFPLRFFGFICPAYYAFVVLAGVAIAALLWLVIAWTDWGLLVRAATRDRTIAMALGVDTTKLMTSVFAASMALVAVAGVLFAPIAGATPGMGLDKTVEAFAVVVVGGLGSVWGSAAAALLFGFLESFGILIVPRFSIAFLFIAMALVLIVRPAGLAGARE